MTQHSPTGVKWKQLKILASISITEILNDYFPEQNVEHQEMRYIAD
jgi:hypothetical protein